jgi:hypothetical protein
VVQHFQTLASSLPYYGGVSDGILKKGYSFSENVIFLMFALLKISKETQRGISSPARFPRIAQSIFLSF